ncbi:MAG: hypothetical protein ACFFC0_04215 [Promethearchaeota archaeon]
MSNAIKASFILAAVGGFITTLMHVPRLLGWNLVPDYQLRLLIFILLGILFSIGFIGLWRKSGNVIPLVCAIFIILMDIVDPVLQYLVDFTTLFFFTTFSWADVMGITMIIYGVAYLTAGISAWLLREEFSPFSIVAALVFFAFGAVNLVIALVDPVGIMLPTQDWWYWFDSATGIVTGIYFLDAART